MPRLIDHEARSSEIAAASLRVLERDGLAGLSVRGVADEAALATASLRRAFPTQHALREHCLVLIEERVTARIAALASQLTGRALVDGMLAQLLPLDRERRSELVAQLQLDVLALTDARLRPSAVRLNAAVGEVCHRCIVVLRDAGELGRGRDEAGEATRLHALLDGVALHALWNNDLVSTDSLAVDSAVAVLARHLDEISRA